MLLIDKHKTHLEGIVNPYIIFKRRLKDEYMKGNKSQSNISPRKHNSKPMNNKY